MATKFLSLEDAAKMLHVSPETLNEMRDRHEVYAYRDGSNWKFKQEEVERLLRERSAAQTESAAEAEFSEIDEGPDSILASEIELGQSDPSTSSTIIGRSRVASGESDIHVAQSNKTNPATSDVKLASDSDVLSVAVPKGGSSGKHDSDLSVKFDDLDALDLELESPLESGITTGSGIMSGTSLAAGSGLTTPPAEIQQPTAGESALDPDELSLALDSVLGLPDSPPAESGSSIDLSSLDDDDSELVLDVGNAPGDISRTGDSGISLLDPADSGLSLDEPLQLGGSGIESMGLGGDMLQLDEQPAADAASDDDFLLTPLEEAAGDDGESGSQVIALDSAEDFDEAATTMLGSPPAGLAMDLVEEGAEPTFAGAGLGTPTMAQGAAFGAPAMSSAPAANEPFTGWNLLLLGLCFFILMLAGMMLYDIMRNMWSWNGPYSVNSSLMDAILSWFE